MTNITTKYFNDYNIFNLAITNLVDLAQPKPKREKTELQQLKEAYIKVAEMHSQYQSALIKGPYRFAEDHPKLINQYELTLIQVKAQYEKIHTEAMQALTIAQPILLENNIKCSPYLLPKPSLLSRIGAVAQKNIDRAGNACLIATAAIGLQYFTGQVFPIVATAAGIYAMERIALSSLSLLAK